MRKLLIILASFIYAGLVNASGRYVLTHEQWTRPKQVESVLQMPAINGVLSDFNKFPASQLVILYPGGDEGTLWASELKAWLVSLGVSSRQMELRPGSSESRVIEMQVESPISGMMKAN